MRSHVTSAKQAVVLNLVSVLAFAGSASAQTAGTSQLEDRGLEEIVVTAQKREQSVQDVGLSIQAFGGERLAEAGVNDVVDVAGLATNVQVNYGLGNNYFNIRGLGLNEFSSNLDAPVAVHVDEIYQSKGFMTGLALFDIERVEVLKGPQGDLFGRNTTGGAVNFFSGRPEREFGGALEAGYDNYETLNVNGHLTGPLSEKLAFRLAGYRTDQGKGYYRNTLRNSREGAVDEFAVRGQIAFEDGPTEILLSAHYGEDRSTLHPYTGLGNTDPRTGQLCAEYLNGTVQGNTPNCVRGLDLLFVPDTGLPGQYQPGENDPYVTANNLPFTVDNWTAGGFLRVGYEFETAVLTSITGYERFSRDQQEDSDNSPVQSVEVYWNNDIRQITQELRLTSNFDDDRWNYVVGAFYESDDYDNKDYLTAFIPFLPNPGNPLNNFSRYEQRTDAFSLFAHVESQLTDQLRLIVGGRYTDETVKVTGGTFGGDGLVRRDGIYQPATISRVIADAAAAPGGNEGKEENASYRFGIEYAPLDDFLIYANLTSGFRSGGYSVNFASVQDELVNLEPETIQAYEVGFKSEFADRRIRINGSVFRFDVDNGHIDVDVPGSPVPITINAPQSKTYGAEIELMWRVFQGFDLSAGVGYTDAKIGSTANEIVGGVQVADFKGNRRAFSPKETFNGQARYETSLTNAADLVISADWNWRSSAFLELNNQPSNLQDAYWVLNGRASVQFGNGVELSIWGKNLTNTDYIVYLNDLPAFGWLLNGYAAPRTFGGSVKVMF